MSWSPNPDHEFSKIDTIGFPRHAPCYLMIACLFCVTGFGQIPLANATLKEELQAAQSYFSDHRYENAKAVLQQALQRFPDSFEANELMGLVLASEGQENAATSYFVKAVHLQPDSGDAHQNLATNLLRLQKADLAESEFKRAATLDPTSFTINHDLGEFYFEYRRMRDAIPYLKKAQEIKPESYTNGYALAVAKFQCGMIREAEMQIDALMSAQDTADLHALLAPVKEEEHNYLAAAQEYQRAAQMNPNEDNIFAWGAELIHHRTLEPAMQVLSHGVELYPRSARLQVGMGIVLFMRELYDAAVDAFCHAVDLTPTDPRPYYFLARIYDMAPSRAGEVTSRLGQLVQIQPRNAQARYYYAMSIRRAARVEPSEADLANIESLLRTAIDLNPDFAEAHFQLGNLLSEEGRDSESVEQYEEATRLDPRLEYAHYRLGQALLKKHDRERGESELQISGQLQTHQLDEREKLTADILRFVYTEPNPSPVSTIGH